MAVSKTRIVVDWFKERLNDRTQLSDLTYAKQNNLLTELMPKQGVWFKRVDTDALFYDFDQWLKSTRADADALNINKNGFMLIFYRATGAKRARTRRGQGNRKLTYVAVFENIDYHRTVLQHTLAGLDTD